MNVLSYLMRSRGPVNSARRLGVIGRRFGISQRKMTATLDAYLDITDQFHCSPTLAVTANLLDRYPRPFRRLAERGAELAVHGYVHTDYAQLDLGQQRVHMDKALAAYRKLGIPVQGFRGPYLGWNADSVAVAREAGLSYGSNRSIAWDVVEPDGISAQSWQSYHKGLLLYKAAEPTAVSALPSTVDGGLLDLPVSLPDDEAMVDRLQLTSQQRVAAWLRILNAVYSRGELFTLVLHHERLPICKDALVALLADARQRAPEVWIAPLRDIAAWWRRREHVRLAVEEVATGEYRVTGPNDEDATILVHETVASPNSEPWCGTYRIASAREISVVNGRAPWIGVRYDAPDEMVRFLEGEGYVVKRGDASICALFIDRAAFSDGDKLGLIDLVERSDAPLVRLWRWPRRSRCALSVTGDIDAMSLIDFLRRPLEV